MGIARTVATFVMASAALALAGCTGDNGDSEAPAPTQTFATPARVCPEELPPLPEGSTESWDLATDAPDLPKASAAWLCKYIQKDAGTAVNHPSDWVWSRDGEPKRLEGAGLDVVAGLLNDLTVFPDGMVCTADLGPRWLVAFQVGDEVWGATIDEYGCRWTRLTEDPFTVAAGHSDDPRLVQGSLRPPTGVLDDLKAAAGLA
ncbi:hypothetical protein [Demequina lutea]|uniref:DUF3558 domain-containing protein n=1 Tax=Demequina lutea TaxID=431489 RepID=A0A7Y9ZCL5_9MICO|nr:hypothetical protein [Demequina lutea]NYI41738.1 hypothetical protein [Demequina lutea]